MQVAIKLDLPQEQITQFRLEYWRLQNQDELESLYKLAKGKVSVLWKIYKELMIIRRMSIEEVASVMNTDHIYHLACSRLAIIYSPLLEIYSIRFSKLLNCL